MDKQLCSRQEGSLCTLKRWQNPGYPRIKPVIAQEREEQGKQIASEEKQQVEVLKPQEHSKFMSSGNYQRRKKIKHLCSCWCKKQSGCFKENWPCLENCTWSVLLQTRTTKTNLGFTGSKVWKWEERKRLETHNFERTGMWQQNNKNVCVYDDSETNEVVEKSMPVTYITHLPTFVTDLLDKYFETGQLVWNGIPTNEILVKVGADHGQGSLKMALQVANTNSPN